MEQLIQKYNELNENLKDVQQQAKNITAKMNDIKSEMENFLTSNNMKSYKFNDFEINFTKKITVSEESKKAPKKEKPEKPIITLSANEQYFQQLKKKK